MGFNNICNTKSLIYGYVVVLRVSFSVPYVLVGSPDLPLALLVLINQDFGIADCGRLDSSVGRAKD